MEKALLADIAPSHLRGTVIGLNATLVGMALLPVSLFAGFLWDLLGVSAPFYFGAGMGLSSSFWVIYDLKRVVQIRKVLNPNITLVKPRNRQKKLILSVLLLNNFISLSKTIA